MALRRKFQHAPMVKLLTILGLGILTVFARAANQAGSPTTASRIVEAIDEAKLVPLAGQTHPLAAPQYDQGAIPDSFPMEHMFLQLRRSSEDEEALQRFIDALQDPDSAHYHQWLTAEELGTKFGPAQSDIDTVVRWLSSHEFQVNEVYKNGLTIDLSGTAGQVREAFHTEIHKYLVNGEEHIANASDPEIPAALAPVVVGFVALHDFMPKALLSKPNKNLTFLCGECGNVTEYAEAPADLATIYNVTPLYKATKAITGEGQTIVVLENSDINSADVAKFRSSFGLSKYSGTYAQIHPGSECKDPGKNEDEMEGAIDAEWAGAVAPDASVQLAACKDSATTFGGFFAAQSLLDSKTPPHIISVSYGSCEAEQGSSANAYIDGLWQQAAGEGVSVFVSAGDSGAAGCDNPDLLPPNFATRGIQANGFASTAYNVATGGTDFLDTYEGVDSTYWSKSNASTGQSAKSYIAEMPWNDSCASDILYSFSGYKSGLAFCNSDMGSNFLSIVAGGGAPSSMYSKPEWQTGIVGIPNDGKRDLPDVSLLAANGVWSHAILFCMSDENQEGAPCDYSNDEDRFNNIAGGTSFTAPQFAGIQALINQKAGNPQGNPNPIFYKLAKAEYGSPSDPNKSRLEACNSSKGKDVGESCIFHDVTVGNSDVPCHGAKDCYDPSGKQYGMLSTSDHSLTEAYPTSTGWDFATGLGSVNVTNLVNSWP